MIRFCVIGTNWITESFIAAASQIPDFELSAVYSRTEEQARKFAEKYEVQTTYTDLQEMAHSSFIDAVYIASPNSLHAEQAILLMNHGKHIICEKPAASNTREWKQMVDTAKRNRVVLMEALKTTLLPNFNVIKENLAKIGTVRRYVANYCQYSSRYDAYKAGTVLNAFNPAFSNGALMDIGVYCLYPLVVLFGRPLEMKATALLLDSGVDGEGSILLKYDDKEAVVSYSKITNSSIPSEIQGEEGSILIHNLNQLEKIELHYKNGTVEDLTQQQEDNTMYYEAKEFIDLIKTNRLESSINSHAHSMLTLEIMDEARKQIGLVFPNDLKS
ncbi:Gfo/Idh/MocA family protein [Halalkalibacter urbisdiaboli]|uniref:Gfo/Idh/MocA family protein n=1 Tax=Halalkalibacter urbisdiaboli TaxID=1960589 RepID=UPI000B43B89A|nr:Gfo/Idh/MocA family oxidoreductase [Halalkalibacter urbisdiaboli]